MLDSEASTHACRGDWAGARAGPETPFLIASTSKLLVTAMIFQLAAEGRLTLDARWRATFRANWRPCTSGRVRI